MFRSGSAVIANMFTTLSENTNGDYCVRYRSVRGTWYLMLKSDSVTVSSFEGVLLIKVGRLFYCGWTITAVLLL